MSFSKDMKRGRIKGLGGNMVIVRRIFSKDYNTKHELKDKKFKKKDSGQCKITIPRHIADSMQLKDRDVIEFADYQKGSRIIRKVDERELE